MIKRTKEIIQRIRVKRNRKLMVNCVWVLGGRRLYSFTHLILPLAWTTVTVCWSVHPGRQQTNLSVSWTLPHVSLPTRRSTIMVGHLYANAMIFIDSTVCVLVSTRPGTTMSVRALSAAHHCTWTATSQLCLSWPARCASVSADNVRRMFVRLCCCCCCYARNKKAAMGLVHSKMRNCRCLVFIASLRHFSYLNTNALSALDIVARRCGCTISKSTFHFTYLHRILSTVCYS